MKTKLNALDLTRIVILLIARIEFCEEGDAAHVAEYNREASTLRKILEKISE